MATKEKRKNERVQLLKLSEDERANYLRIGLALQSIGCDQMMALRIIKTYERIGKLGGNFSIDDAVGIDMEIKELTIREKLEEDSES